MSTSLLRIGVTVGAIMTVALGSGCLAETTESEEELDTAEQDLGATDFTEPPEETKGEAVPGVVPSEPDPEPMRPGGPSGPGSGEEKDGEGDGEP